MKQAQANDIDSNAYDGFAFIRMTRLRRLYEWIYSDFL
jgi:hypothetical protein